MKEALVILSLMGCDDAATTCEHIQVANAVYQTQEACLKASESFFDTHADAGYPTVLAKCDAKVPTVAHNRPVANDADISEHTNTPITPFEPILASADEAEKAGMGKWFRVKISNSASAISEPIANTANSLATGSANAASWMYDSAKSAIDYVNPF